MIVFVQMQDVVGLIKNVKRGKICANQFRYAVNADIDYSIDIETVDLSSQGRYLFEQGNAAVLIYSRPIGVFIGSFHGFKTIEAGPILRKFTWFYDAASCIILVSDISVEVFGKKPVKYQVR